MSFLHALLSWLGLDRPSGKVGLRPHRSLEVPLPLPAARQKALEGIDRILGATVYTDEEYPNGGAFIEAGFGLVNSERMRVSLDRTAPAATAVRIEAIYPANVIGPERSLAVEELAVFLRGES